MTRELTFEEITDSRFHVELGVDCPYDDRKATDIFHKTAHGILSELTSRSGVGNELESYDRDIREEITEVMANIISVSMNDHIDTMKLTESSKVGLKEFKELFIRNVSEEVVSEDDDDSDDEDKDD